MTQTYLLKSNIAGDNLHSLTMYLRSDTLKGSRMGDLSYMVKRTAIFAYDYPEIKDKFPSGFRTENAIFVSATFLKESNLDKEETNTNIAYKDAINVIANGLVDMIKDYVNIDVMTKLKLVKESTGIEQPKISSVEFISLNDLTLLLTNSGMKPEQVDVIKETLGKNSEEHEKNILNGVKKIPSLFKLLKSESVSKISI